MDNLYQSRDTPEFLLHKDSFIDGHVFKIYNINSIFPGFLNSCLRDLAILISVDVFTGDSLSSFNKRLIIHFIYSIQIRMPLMKNLH